MERTGFIEHQERQIVFMNFAGIENVEEGLKIIEEARQFVAAQPRRRNLLTLVDVTGSTQDSRVVDAMKELAEHDKPWVLAGAVVGVSALKRMMFRLVVMLSGRKLATFASLDDAKDWLVHQWVPDDTLRFWVLWETLRFIPGLALVAADRELHEARFAALGARVRVPGVPGVDDPPIAQRGQRSRIDRQLLGVREGDRLAP